MVDDSVITVSYFCEFLINQEFFFPLWRTGFHHKVWQILHNSEIWEPITTGFKHHSCYSRLLQHFKGPRVLLWCSFFPHFGLTLLNYLGLPQKHQALSNICAFVHCSFCLALNCLPHYSISTTPSRLEVHHLLRKAIPALCPSCSRCPHLAGS